MALRHWKCRKCKTEFRSFKDTPLHCGVSSELVLKTPNAKILEPVNKYKGKSNLKDQQKILKKRSREHARDFEINDYIATSSKEQVIKNKWINPDGQKRRKIDDI